MFPGSNNSMTDLHVESNYFMNRFCVRSDKPERKQHDKCLSFRVTMFLSNVAA